jgi:uncharacterized membrane-anchored protein YitT (DUF2179 family)
MTKFKAWLQKEKNVIIQEFTSEPPRKIVKNLLFVLLGALVYSIGDSFFIIPMSVISGGVTSLSLIFHSIPGFDVMSVQTYVLIITWGFFLLGLIMIGLKYSLKQLMFAIAYPLFDFFFQWVLSAAVINGVHILDISQISQDIIFTSGATIEANSSGMLSLSYIVAAIFGGAITGAGIGLTFVGGGSSGGTDVINILNNKYFGIRIGTSSFLMDLLIIVGGFFSNGYKLLPTLIGLITAFICSAMIDKVFLGNNRYYLAQIVSTRYVEINDFINKQLGRGTTLLIAKGGYTKKDTTVIEACFDKQDYALIKQSIYQIDPNAFVTFISTTEILGYGFSRDKPRVEGEVTISPDDARKLQVKAHRKRKKTFYYDED